ncbi:MAG: UDP-N-acetylglucosamine--N-acetylmuramyl-(pentapeptide) pyrophosphoryl-undecaprenol N-acetylglucosamine transferase, partial [Candidatus Omnitrophota bacterium]
LAGFADKIAVSFPESRRYFPKGKTVYTGCPVRKELLSVDRDAALRRFGFQDDKFTVLVLGGSKGSHSLNEKFIEALRDFPQKERLRIIHLCGDTDYQRVSKAYQEIGVSHLVLAFLKGIGYAYKLADLVVSRAGASAIAELASFGLPAILVPYPFAGGHQYFNARVLTKAGAAIMVEDKALSGAALKQNILGLMDDRQRLKEMGRKSLSCAAPEAVEDLAAQLIQLAGGKCVSRKFGG